MTDLTQHWRTSFENLYFGSWNLWNAQAKRYATATLTIERIEDQTVTMQGGRKEKARLVFLKSARGPVRAPMILTKKMGRMIASMYGPIPAAWIGQEITIYVEAGFKTKDGPADVLRIKNARAGASIRQAVEESAPEPERGEPEQFGDVDEREPGVD